MKSIAREACIKIKNNPQQWKQIYKEFSFFFNVLFNKPVISERITISWYKIKISVQ